MQLTPIIAIHMSAAIAALVIGPVVLWTRLGKHIRPWLHRALGYAWTTLMLVAGAFTLLPTRYLGQLIWHEWLGWL
ncbi:DUF2306 domain-containing protein [Limnohabitans sp.]|uniref:DUF2306 domain-containing protein n=1 Tax=Limnohabitans sp. TaxID=1907725 RepID=UPI00286F8F1C|nr:DUF2306 domain-containing protein [Limnohabitans sp.]